MGSPKIGGQIGMYKRGTVSHWPQNENYLLPKEMNVQLVESYMIPQTKL